MATDLQRLKQSIPLLEYLQRHNWRPCRAGNLIDRYDFGAQLNELQGHELVPARHSDSESKSGFCARLTGEQRVRSSDRVQAED